MIFGDSEGIIIMENPCKTCEIEQSYTTMSQVTNCEKFKLYQEYLKNLKEIERMDILGKTEDDYKAQKKVLTDPCINCLGKCVNSDGSIYPCDVGCRARDLYILAKHDQFLEECSKSVKRLNSKLDELTVEVKEVTDNIEKLLSKSKLSGLIMFSLSNCLIR